MRSRQCLIDTPPKTMPAICTPGYISPRGTFVEGFTDNSMEGSFLEGAIRYQQAIDIISEDVRGRTEGSIKTTSCSQ